MIIKIKNITILKEIILIQQRHIKIIEKFISLKIKESNRNRFGKIKVKNIVNVINVCKFVKNVSLNIK